MVSLRAGVGGPVGKIVDAGVPRPGEIAQIALIMFVDRPGLAVGEG